MPICNTCKVEKLSSDFSPDKRKKSGLQNKCKHCSAQWLRDRPEYTQRWWFAKKYGITLEDFKKMRETQNGVCASCGNPEWRTDPRTGKLRELCVDHDHRTFVVRGLLCDDCNVAVGRLKDNPYRAMSVYKYLCINGTVE